MNCRVVLAQTRPRLGSVAHNLEEHLERAKHAAGSGADLIVFPELSLTGYFLKDQTADLALELDAPEIAALAEASRRISIAAGFVERARDGRLYNSIGFFEDGELLHVHRKVHLVSYGMFDEARDFAPGEAFHTFDSKHGRFGLLACEDFWHIGGSYLYFLNGVDAIFVCSSSPARGVSDSHAGLASASVWDTMLRAASLWFQTYVVYVNRVGWEDGVGFAGGSLVRDPFGDLAVDPAGIEPALVEARLAGGHLRRARVETPLRRDEKPWLLARELCRSSDPGEDRGEATSEESDE